MNVWVFVVITSEASGKNKLEQPVYLSMLNARGDSACISNIKMHYLLKEIVQGYQITKLLKLYMVKIFLGGEFYCISLKSFIAWYIVWEVRSIC